MGLFSGGGLDLILLRLLFSPGQKFKAFIFSVDRLNQATCLAADILLTQTQIDIFKGIAEQCPVQREENGPFQQVKATANDVSLFEPGKGSSLR